MNQFVMIRHQRMNFSLNQFCSVNKFGIANPLQNIDITVQLLISFIQKD